MSTFDTLYESLNLAEWENYPSIKTPLAQINLNKLNAGLRILFEALYSESRDKVTVGEYTEKMRLLDQEDARLSTVMVDEDEAQGWVTGLEFDESTGQFTVKRFNQDDKVIDTNIEKITLGIGFDKDTQEIILYTDAEKSKELTRVYIGDFITNLEVVQADDATVSVDITSEPGKVKLGIVPHSIGEEQLRVNYLADIKISEENAKSSETNAKESETNAKTSETSALDSEKLAESYTHGNTGIREGEDTDNAEYYKNQSKFYAEQSMSGMVASYDVVGTVKPDGESILLELDEEGKSTGKIYVNPETITKPLNEIKEQIGDTDISEIGETITDAVAKCFQSANDGKATVANAIKNKLYPTEDIPVNNITFKDLGDYITNINTPALNNFSKAAIHYQYGQLDSESASFEYPIARVYPNNCAEIWHKRLDSTIYVVTLESTNRVVTLALSNDTSGESIVSVTLVSLGAVYYNVRIEKLYTISPDDFIIVYRYETNAAGALSTYQVRRVQINVDNQSTASMTVTTALAFGTATALPGSGSAYYEHTGRFIPLKHCKGLDAERGLYFKRATYNSAGTYVSAHLYWNEIFQNNVNGTLAWNSGTFNNVAALNIAGSTAKDAGFFDSNFGGVAYYSVSSSTAVTIKFVHRIGGRAFQPQANIALYPKVGTTNYESVDIIGCLSDGVSFIGYMHGIDPESPGSNHFVKDEVYILKYNTKTSEFVKYIKLQGLTSPDEYVLISGSDILINLSNKRVYQVICDGTVISLGSIPRAYIRDFLPFYLTSYKLISGRGMGVYSDIQQGIIIK